MLSAGQIQKSIRTKNIKLNGKRAQYDARLLENDVVAVYLPDSLLTPPSPDDAWRLIKNPQLDVLYEDANILLIDKKPGVAVQPDKNETVNTVSSRLKAYLFRKGEWSPEDENTFAPALCNRIDRNTAGIVIAAKKRRGAAHHKRQNKSPRNQEALPAHYPRRNGSSRRQTAPLSAQGHGQQPCARAQSPRAGRA